MRFFKLLLALPLLVASSCSLPDTPLWNQRQDLPQARMPMEMTTKVILWGNVKSTVSNPISGTQKGLNMWRERSALLTQPLELPSSIRKHGKLPQSSISDGLDQLNLPKTLPGSIDFLIDGKNFYSSLFKSARKAKHSIDTRIFIFDNDDIATQYADLLKKKSSQVRCRVIMDELGSISSWWTTPMSKQPEGFKPPSSIPHYLRSKSKVRVRESKNPWLVADHTKLFIFDQKIAYIGGMNIGREYRYEWHDMMVKLSGPVVTQLQNEFNHSWIQQGFLGDFRMPFHRHLKAKNSTNSKHIPLRILKTSSQHKHIETAMIAAIRMSKQRIYLQNSYVTSELLIKELGDAAKRGVVVKLIIPQENDSKLLHSANHIAARQLIQAGAKVYSYPNFSHIKAMVVDDWCCLGSANFDGLSMRINEEINISFEHKKTTQKLVSNLFLKDFKKSKRLYLHQLKKLPKALSTVTGQL